VGPDHQRSKAFLAAMPHDDKISADLSGEFSYFLGWLAPHKFGYGVKTQLFQSRDAFIEYFPEAIFHLNGCPSESYLGQQQSAGIENG
jgi:hypothetical protein